MFESLWELLSGRRHPNRNRVPHPSVVTMEVSTATATPPTVRHQPSTPTPPPARPKPPERQQLSQPPIRPVTRAATSPIVHQPGTGILRNAGRRHSMATTPSALGVPGNLGGPINNRRIRRRGASSGEMDCSAHHRRRQHKYRISSPPLPFSDGCLAFFLFLLFFYANAEFPLIVVVIGF